MKKYDYTKVSLSLLEGKNGNIEYDDDLKKLLDDGWRIISAEGWLILEKERQN